MSQKRMSPSLKSLIDNIRSVINESDWKTFDAALDSLSKTIKQKDLERICLEQSIFQEAFEFGSTSRWNRGKWAAEKILEHTLPLHIEISDKLLRKSEVDQVKCILINNGIYKNVSSIDYVAENGSGNSQVIAAQWCSIKTLRSLKGHKSSKLRKVYFNRLGPVECLDEMLSDRIADIRYEGIARAPYDYKKLISLTREIARSPFSLLIKKIPLDYLPMLLANRNVKDRWISNLFEQRMSSGR